LTAPSTLSSTSFHSLATKLRADKSSPPFALQIGAMDGIRFDLLYPHIIQGGWHGLLVEPVKDMFSLLQKTYIDQPNIKLVNCAISDHDGTLTLKRVDPAAVSQGLIPEEALGITTSLNSGTLLSDPRLSKAFPLLKPEHIIKYTAPCLTLQSLLSQHMITDIDLIVIDTEGSDWLIVRQLDLKSYKPLLICLEHSSLSDADKGACMKHFIENDYTCALCEEDHENILFFKETLSR